MVEREGPPVAGGLAARQDVHPMGLGHASGGPPRTAGGHSRSVAPCVYDTVRSPPAATAQGNATVTPPPRVGVTGTTEPIRGLPRVRVNEGCALAVELAGMIPVVLPPFRDARPATSIIRSLDGLL